MLLPMENGLFSLIGTPVLWPVVEEFRLYKGFANLLETVETLV